MFLNKPLKTIWGILVEEGPKWAALLGAECEILFLPRDKKTKWNLPNKLIQNLDRPTTQQISLHASVSENHWNLPKSLKLIHQIPKLLLVEYILRIFLKKF